MKQKPPQPIARAEAQSPSGSYYCCDSSLAGFIPS